MPENVLLVSMRFAAIEPLLEEAKSSTQTICVRARVIGTSRTRLQRWLDGYGRYGLKGLEDKSRRGRRPARKTSKSCVRLRAIRPLLPVERRTAENIHYHAWYSGFSDRTIREWLRRYDVSGVAGLRDAKPRSKSMWRTLASSPSVVSFVAIRFERGLSYAAIFRALMRDWESLCPGAPKPNSAHHVNKLVRSLCRVVFEERPEARP
jgi:hypothetical protein